MKKNLRQQSRQLAIILCSILCVVVSVRGFYEASLQKEGMLLSLALASLLSGLAYGIIKQYRWALRLAAGILLAVVVFLPVGLFNPFSAGDYLVAGKQPIPVAETLLWLVPVEILLLAIVFLIDPSRKRPDNEQS
jgi:hypothetical protein